MGLDSEVTASRAYTDFHDNTTDLDTKSIVIGIENNNEKTAIAEPSNRKLKQRKRYPSNGSPANLVYWDDVSSDTYDVRKGGVTVNIWAAKLTSGVTTLSDGTPAISDDDKINWTIDANQKTNGIDKNDLLVADYQSEYTASPSAVPLCFHHAMTKITVNIKKKETNSGFTDDEITNAPAVTLKSFYKEAKVDITKKKAKEETGDETGFVTPNVEAKNTVDFSMHKTTTADGYSVSFDAIVAPGNTITTGAKIATITITDTHGKTNSYYLNATAELIRNWGGTDGSVTLKYGVNYIINATVSKQEITFNAKVVAWGDKTGEGDAKINFTPDVTAKGSIATELQTSGFDVYKSSVNTTFGSKVTTLTYSDGWTYDPVIYWAGQEDASYFRALSPAGTTTSISQGTDVLWGYACDIAGATPTVEERAKIGTTDEVQITPRTGNVPLHFEHAMSKITVNLETSADAAAVALAGATIQITHMATSGTIELNKGSITGGALQEKMLSEDATSNPKRMGFYAGNDATKTSDDEKKVKLSGYTVIPQTFSDRTDPEKDAYIIITLADGTTYKAKLNSIKAYTVDGDGNHIEGEAITEWLRGMHYTYTIHLEKEAITFRALVKKWEDAKGSGNATLDWD